MASDSESVYSVDSLEGENKVKSKSKFITTNRNKYPTNNINTTIPFYKGEISVEDIKPNIKVKARTKVPCPKISKSATTRQSHYVKANSEKENGGSNQVSSQRNNDASTQPQVTGRISRRNDSFVQNKYPLKVRHRSVSYLEQYRRNNYGNNSLDLSSYSTTGSKSSRERSVSFISSFSSGSTRMSSSEINFYDELMVSPRNEGQSCIISKESLRSSTLLTKKSVKSADVNRHSNKIKAKPIVLTRVDVMIPVEQKKELNKKKIVEVYANKVKMRNKIKIDRQKERDRIEKFDGSRTNFSFEDCFLQLKQEPNNGFDSFPNINVSCLPPSSQPPTEVKQTRNKPRVLEEKVGQKCKGIKINQNKQTKKNLEITLMHERHEKEKSLIESLKKLYLKT